MTTGAVVVNNPYARRKPKEAPGVDVTAGGGGGGGAALVSVLAPLQQSNLILPAAPLPLQAVAPTPSRKQATTAAAAAPPKIATQPHPVTLTPTASAASTAAAAAAAARTAVVTVAKPLQQPQTDNGRQCPNPNLGGELSVMKLKQQLQRELVELKRQQKLQKERLAMHKHQRKLQKQQQKQQQQLKMKANAAASVTVGSAKPSTHAATNTNTDGDPQPQLSPETQAQNSVHVPPVSSHHAVAVVPAAAAATVAAAAVKSTAEQQQPEPRIIVQQLSPFPVFPKKLLPLLPLPESSSLQDAQQENHEDTAAKPDPRNTQRPMTTWSSSACCATAAAPDTDADTDARADTAGTATPMTKIHGTVPPTMSVAAANRRNSGGNIYSSHEQQSAAAATVAAATTTTTKDNKETIPSLLQQNQQQPTLSPTLPLAHTTTTCTVILPVPSAMVESINRPTAYSFYNSPPLLQPWSGNPLLVPQQQQQQWIHQHQYNNMLRLQQQQQQESQWIMANLQRQQQHQQQNPTLQQQQYSTHTVQAAAAHPMVSPTFTGGAMAFGGGAPFQPQMQQHQQQTSFGYGMVPHFPVSQQPMAVAPPALIPRAKVNAVTSATSKKPTLLAANPCLLPSPFAVSHYILQHPILLVKQHPDQSFGVKLVLDMESALVEPELQNAGAAKPADDVPTPGTMQQGPREGVELGEVNATTAMTAAPSSADLLQLPVGTTLPRRPRRRRAFFSVLAVHDPTEQNNRRKHLEQPTVAKADTTLLLLLQKDDILLTIAGKSTAGLTFPEACGLFKDCVAVDANGMIGCQVTIARRRRKHQVVVPVAVVPPIIPAAAVVAPLQVHHGKPELRVGPLGSEEIFAVCSAFLKANTDPRRLLGGPVSGDLVRQLIAAEPALAARGGGEFFQFQEAWNVIGNQVEYAAQQKAIAYWKQKWSQEPENVRATHNNLKYLTDAQRSVMRAAPRRPNHCKCESADHKYMNDVNCPLYSNLRTFLDDSAVDAAYDTTTLDEAEVAKRRRTLAKSLSRDLNVVEKAFKDRFVREKVEQEAEGAEARFVTKMEDIQLTTCNQAILAPSLSVMVLSAVVELQSEFEGKELTPLIPSPLTPESVSDIGAQSGEDSDDDDDDVPLAALGKRPSDDNEKVQANKRQRGCTPVRPQLLAKLVQLISKKWGHVFREASNEEYAWRWEVYHGQASESGSKWDTNTNPRSAGNLSLENIWFVLDDNVAAHLEHSDQSPFKLEALKILAHVLSPSRTGLFDELLALVRTNVLAVDDQGIPALAKDWWSRVDLLLLEEMSESWGLNDDTNVKYGVAENIRKTLHRKWARSYKGWALANDKEDIIFDFEEFDEWRVAFEDKQRARSDGVDGVGRFR